MEGWGYSETGGTYVSMDTKLELMTPLLPLRRLSENLGVDLWIKRDDLFPLTGGGNKGRKIVYIARDVAHRGADSVVTTGGLQSNHARATALMAAKHGWKCKLVLHGEESHMDHPQGNLLLMCLAGADIVVVPPEKIGPTMRESMDEFASQGRKPYEIPGGGHMLAGSVAYVEAIKELEYQRQSGKWIPECIILASGTGTTQAGILGGLDMVGWETRVAGISVARRNPRGRLVVEQAYADLRQHLGVNGSGRYVDFRDDWTGDGYQRPTDATIAAIRVAASVEGLMLDPTYTGKAFAALLDMIRGGEIKQGSRVLFWHTGGLLNLAACDCFSREVWKT